MGAQIRILPTEEADYGFSLLKDIIEMVKNPKAVDEAYARRKQAAQLTDDEVVKSSEARALIAKSDSLRDELKKREDILSAAKLEHEKSVESHRVEMKKLSDALTLKSNELDSIATQQSEDKNNLDSDRAKLKSDTEQASIILDARESKLMEREKQLAGNEADNVTKASKIADWEAKLKAKAARLAAEAAS